MNLSSALQAHVIELGFYHLQALPVVLMLHFESLKLAYLTILFATVLVHLAQSDFFELGLRDILRKLLRSLPRR